MSFAFTKTVLLAGALSLGTIALAHAAPAEKPAAPEGGERRVMVFRGGPEGAGPGMRMRMHRMDPEKQAQHLRDVLQLTPAQEPALKTFIAAMAPPEPMWKHKGADEAAPPAPPPAPMTTPERLDRQAEMMARHHAAFEKRASAIKAFYAQLSASQKKAFDALRLDRPHGPRGAGGPMMERRVKVIRKADGGAPQVITLDGEAGPAMAMFQGDDGALVEFEFEGGPMLPGLEGLWEEETVEIEGPGA